MKILKKLSVLLLTAIMTINCFSTFAATTIGYNAVSTVKSNTYNDNSPINRVFYVKTGNTTASRTLKFNQTPGEISYYMYRNTSKSCYQRYRIFVYNNDTKKSVGNYYWDWTRSKSVKLPKNANLIVFVYPEDFDTVLNKYLSTKILGLRPIINGYTKSPHYTITTSAKITYNEKDSIKIAGA